MNSPSSFEISSIPPPVADSSLTAICLRCPADGCNSTFGTEKALVEHYKLHEVKYQVKFVCTLCMKRNSFTRKADASRHYKSKHTELSSDVSELLANGKLIKQEFQKNDYQVEPSTHVRSFEQGSLPFRNYVPFTPSSSNAPSLGQGFGTYIYPYPVPFAPSPVPSNASSFGQGFIPFPYPVPFAPSPVPSNASSFEQGFTPFPYPVPSSPPISSSLNDNDNDISFESRGNDSTITLTSNASVKIRGTIFYIIIIIFNIK